MVSQAKILIAGGSGLIGSFFAEEAVKKGYRISLLTRNKKLKVTRKLYHEVLVWEPQRVLSSRKERTDLLEALNDVDIVMNLSGSSIAAGRLNEEHIQDVRESRLLPTNALLQAYRECTRKPRLWIQASAVGYYGDRKEEELTEESSVGSGVLSQICQKWENTILQSKIIDSKKTRILILRIGIVLAKNSRGWNKIILPIKLNLGGALGSGKQWYSWIHIKDLAAAIFYLINHSKESGIFNLVAPTAIRQKDMAQNIASRLKKIAILPTPGFLLRIVAGNLADELILASAKAIPKKLLEAKFSFDHVTFKDALEELIP